MHGDRISRALLALVALLLLIAGVAGLLAGAGAFGTGIAHRDLLNNPFSRYVGTHGGWFWPAAAAAGAILALVALWWLLTVVFSTGRVGQVRIAGSGGPGGTRLSGSALTDALESEIENYPQVRSSRAQLLGDSTRPRLRVRVDAEQDADLAALCHRLERGALAHARQALDAPHLPVRLDVAVSRHEPTRVH